MRKHQSMSAQSAGDRDPNSRMLKEGRASSPELKEEDNDSSQMEKGLFFQDPTDEADVEEMVKGYINTDNSNHKNRNSNEH